MRVCARLRGGSAAAVGLAVVDRESAPTRLVAATGRWNPRLPGVPLCDKGAEQGWTALPGAASAVVFRPRAARTAGPLVLRKAGGRARQHRRTSAQKLDQAPQLANREPGARPCNRHRSTPCPTLPAACPPSWSGAGLKPVCSIGFGTAIACRRSSHWRELPAASASSERGRAANLYVQQHIRRAPVRRSASLLV